MFKVTTALKKILQLKGTVRGIQGGTSAGKTFNVLPILMDYCIKNTMTECSVVAESVPHLRRGAMRDFKKIMKVTGRWIESNWAASTNTYTFSNGSYIEFFSADDDSKLRGARRDVLYMNEANNMTFHAYTELVSRTKQFTYLDWNPTNEFWFHQDVQGGKGVDFLVINYLDNEAIPESALDFILSAKDRSKTSPFWANWYKVYGLGQLGSLEGAVFSNWKQIETIPNDAYLVGSGMDFGYTNDPTTLVTCYLWEGKLIVDQKIYSTGLLNSDIYREAAKHRTGMIYADSAEPKSIAELRRMGLSITATKKGRDSIVNGIALLQEYDILVTKTSTDLVKELRNYRWDRDKEGTALNKPIDDFNHGLDALRYLALMRLTKKRRFSAR